MLGSVESEGPAMVLGGGVSSEGVIGVSINMMGLSVSGMD